MGLLNIHCITSVWQRAGMTYILLQQMNYIINSQEQHVKPDEIRMLFVLKKKKKKVLKSQNKLLSI